MTPDPTRPGDATGIRQELDLLGEAVSLLVRRRRQNTTWIKEQVRQAEQRAADSERRRAELEGRLAQLESQLERLVQDFKPGADETRIALLHEQIQDLSVEQPESVQVAPSASVAQQDVRKAQVVPAHDVRTEPPHGSVSAPAEEPARSDAVSAASTHPTKVTFWDMLGATRQDRVGVVLMGLGAVGVLYALLTQLRLS